MPLGEIIAEIIVRPIIEIVVYGIFYITGRVVLFACSFGQLRLAPIDAYGEKSEDSDLRSGIWLRRPGQRPAIRAEVQCVVVVIVWLAGAVAIYIFMT